MTRRATAAAPITRRGPNPCGHPVLTATNPEAHCRGQPIVRFCVKSLRVIEIIPSEEV